MCNTNYKLEPTVAPKIQENTPYQETADELNFLQVVGIGCGIAFVVAILFLVAFLYRNKKNALFNEVPTVCIYLIGELVRRQTMIFALFFFRGRVERT